MKLDLIQTSAFKGIYVGLNELRKKNGIKFTCSYATSRFSTLPLDGLMFGAEAIITVTSSTAAKTKTPNSSESGCQQQIFVKPAPKSTPKLMSLSIFATRART